MARARVEQRGRAGHVLEARQELLQLDRLGGGRGHAARDAQEEILRRLDDLAGARMAQQVAVVDRTQTEVLEQIGAVVVDCEKDWMSWLATSLATNVASRRAANREYSGSSATCWAAV